MLELEFVKATDPRYLEIRRGHYPTEAHLAREDMTNKATGSLKSQGQQIHFLVHVDDRLVGAISGGAAVYGVKARDEFFDFPAGPDRHKLCIERPCKHDYMQAVVDNTLFRMMEPAVRASDVLKAWRPVTAKLWEEIYGVPVIGFETFVDGDGPDGDPRSGYIYHYDRWKRLGKTQGRVKTHTKAVGMHGNGEMRTFRNTTQKWLFAKWHQRIVPSLYESGWDWNKKDHMKGCAAGQQGTGTCACPYRWDEETRIRKKAFRNRKRDHLYGARFV